MTVQPSSPARNGSITAAGAPPQHDPMSRHLSDADQTLGARHGLGWQAVLLAPHAVGYLRRLGIGHALGSQVLVQGGPTDRRPVRMVGVATSNLFRCRKGARASDPGGAGPRPLQPFERS